MHEWFTEQIRKSHGKEYFAVLELYADVLNSLGDARGQYIQNKIEPYCNGTVKTNNILEQQILSQQIFDTEHGFYSWVLYNRLLFMNIDDERKRTT